MELPDEGASIEPTKLVKTWKPATVLGGTVSSGEHPKAKTGVVLVVEVELLL